jgi:uncharacterized membrane protein YdjX (TVP38/TMEM64 family)
MEPELRDAAPPSDPRASHDARQSPAGAREILRRLGPAGVLAVLAGTLPLVGSILLFWWLTELGPWLRSHQQLGVLIYIAGFIVFAGLALLPTYAQAILGGWAFGFRVGFPAALVGFVGGALLGYVIARRATGERVVRLLDEHPRWRAVYDALLRGGFWRTLGIVTLIRLPPNSPFAMTNLVLAATRVPLSIFLLGTAAGMAPRTAAAVFVAQGLKELTFTESANRPLWIAGLVLTVVVVVIVGLIANRAVERVTAP